MYFTKKVRASNLNKYFIFMHDVKSSGKQCMCVCYFRSNEFAFRALLEIVITKHRLQKLKMHCEHVSNTGMQEYMTYQITQNINAVNCTGKCVHSVHTHASLTVIDDNILIVTISKSPAGHTTLILVPFSPQIVS